MAGPYSYIDYGRPGEYNDAWSLIFRDMYFLDQCWEKKIFFSLMGDLDEPDPMYENRCMALIVTNDSQYRFSRHSWKIFRDALRPHTYQQSDAVIKFSDVRIELNIYAFLYASIHHDTLLTNPNRIVHDYYKSGTMLIYCTSMNTYREAVPEATGYVDPGPITRSENGRGYVVQFDIACRRRRLTILPSIIDTWG